MSRTKLRRFFTASTVCIDLTVELVQELRMSLRTHFYDVSYLRVTESEPLRWNQLSDEEGQDEDLSEEDCLYE